MSTDGSDAELGPADADQPAGRVVALLLSSQHAAHRARLSAASDGLDRRSVRRLRVPLRRSEAILTATAGVVPPEEAELLVALMSQLDQRCAELLGALDVRTWAESELAGLGEPLDSGGTALLEALDDRCAAERRRSTDLLGSDLVPVLDRRWRRLASVYRVGGEEPGPDANRAASEVLDGVLEVQERQLRRCARRARRTGDADSWAQVLHTATTYRDLVRSAAPLLSHARPDTVASELGRLRRDLGALRTALERADFLVDVAADLGGAAAMTAGALAHRSLSLVGPALEAAPEAWARADRPAARLRRQSLRSAAADA